MGKIYDSSLTKKKAAIEGGSAGGAGLIMAAILGIIHGSFEVGWDAETDAAILVAGTAVITAVFRAWRNWRKHT